MRRVERLGAKQAVPAAEVVVLDFDARRKRRFIARLPSGEEVSVFLPRGTLLADGDELEANDGSRIRVAAADEPLSVVSAPDPLLFARIAYHLGNRHVPLAITPSALSYRHDHVLDDLVRRLGGTVRFANAPFSPEGGAYGPSPHDHGHHDHDHHDHDHHGHDHHDHDHDHEPVPTDDSR